MITKIRKRNGMVVDFDDKRIQRAIDKAVVSCGGQDFDKAARITRQVVLRLEGKYADEVPTVEQVQDVVEEVLIRNGHAKVSKAYILYREQHTRAREKNALIGATVQMFERYLGDKDWKVQENANQQKSINGLNNYVREAFTKHYWLHEILPESVRTAHENGDGHIHDLGFFGPYCAGWDLRQLLQNGFGGVPGKVESKPAKHLRSFLGQVVNSTFTTQGECAGAQAWSSIDTYCAPFIRIDNMNYEQVRQCLQEFIFNLNVPTRVGFQCPFSNLTFDLTVPQALKNQAVLWGGEPQEYCYGEFQAEMDLFNRAFCDAMMQGDRKGRVFTFPIPTINISKTFDYQQPAFAAFMQTAAKYGIPYFANYVNSDLSPEDAVSMCCRLRLDTKQLRARGGGLFGSNPLTGSIGVYTINLPRIGYKSKGKGIQVFLSALLEQLEIARIALETKRKILEKHTQEGLYPYCANFLEDVKARTGLYWYNHFSTIGILGMHEALVNLSGAGIDSKEGKQNAQAVLHFIRSVLQSFQQETGHVYNLEATPAEGASHRLALLDKQLYPDCYTSGEQVVYYTNSTQLPANSAMTLPQLLEHQDDLQALYTGGTVQHLYLGEAVPDSQAMGVFLKHVFESTKIPYVSFTPTFSICAEHGYLLGEQFECSICGKPAEVWSRVTGYLRPVQNFNKGKREEYRLRTQYDSKTLHEPVPNGLENGLQTASQNASPKALPKAWEAMV
jgi:ribonucleoside-triphosphate reductase (formate)